KDKGTGKEQKIRIEASSGLTEAEIERMKQEAQANAEADRQARERVEKINQADSMIFQTEKQLKEYGDKLSEGNKSAINAALEKLRKAHGAQDVPGIDAALAELNTAWQAASAEMYQASSGAAGGANASGAGNTGSSGNDSDVSDVEFEEVKDNNKK